MKKSVGYNNQVIHVVESLNCLATARSRARIKVAGNSFQYFPRFTV